MKFKIAIELDLPDREMEQLARSLNCKTADLSGRFAPYVSAAAEEYVRMFLGQKVFTRGSDIREYRLFLLIQHVFGNSLPDEQKISDLFQTTASQSSSLVRSVMSKFQYDLRDKIDATCQSIVASVAPGADGTLTTVIPSPNLVEKLNRRIAAIDGTLPVIARKPDAASTYVFPKSTYLRLCEVFIVTPKVKEK